MLLEDVYLIKVVGVVEENQDVEKGDGATGVVMLLGEVGGRVDGDAGRVPKLCKPSSEGVPSWQGPSWESIEDVGVEAVRRAGCAKQHRPVSIVVKDGNCVHVVVRVVAFLHDSSRIDWVEVLDGSASDMVMLVEDVAHRQVDVGVRQSKLSSSACCDGADAPQPEVGVDPCVLVDELAILEVERPVTLLGSILWPQRGCCLDLSPVGRVVEDDKDVDLDW